MRNLTVRQARKQILVEGVLEPPKKLTRKVGIRILRTYCAFLRASYRRRLTDGSNLEVEFPRTAKLLDQFAGDAEAVIERGKFPKWTGYTLLDLSDWKHAQGVPEDVLSKRMAVTLSFKPNPRHSGMVDPHGGLTIYANSDDLRLGGRTDEQLLRNLNDSVYRIWRTVHHEMVHVLQLLLGSRIGKRQQYVGKPGPRRVGTKDTPPPAPDDHVANHALMDVEFQPLLQNMVHDYERWHGFDRFDREEFLTFVGAKDLSKANDRIAPMRRHDPRRWKYAVGLLYNAIQERVAEHERKRQEKTGKVN